VGFPWAAVSFRARSPTPLRSYVGCKGTTCLTMVFSRGCSGIPAQVPGAPPPPPPPSSPRARRAVSHILPSPPSRVLPFLTRTLPRCRHSGCRAGPWPAAGPLKLAGTGCVRHGAAPAAPHRGTPRSPLPAPGRPHPVQQYKHPIQQYRRLQSELNLWAKEKMKVWMRFR